MRNLMIMIASVGLLLTTACDKKKDSNGFSPNSCYVSGGSAGYSWVNGRCVNVQNNQPVQPGQEYRCNQAQQGRSYDPRCSQYGGNNQGFPPNYNQPGFGGYGDACNVYGPGWVTSRGIMGELICVNASTWSHVSSYYGSGSIPQNYGGYYQTCLPSSANCNCRSFGGTLGWVSGGAYVGYCF